MSWPNVSNHRAVFFLLGLCGVSLLPVVPALAAGHLIDPAGVSGDLFGRSAVLLEDINGDGHDEAVVGAPGVNGGSGKLCFWWGGATTTAAPDFTYAGTVGEGLGWCVAVVGDVNNGGKPDLAVGAPYASTNTGRVLLFYGEDITAGGFGTPDIIVGAAVNDGFGFAIAAAGDFDGDNRADFVVGAPDPRALSDAASHAGKAYVIFGAGGGPSTSLGDALLLSGPTLDSRFGWSVAGAGNFLGGTRPSVAVGAPLYDSFGLNAGAVFVYEGGASPDATVDHTLHSGAANVAQGWYGYSVANAGRWDADSYDDLAVGAPYNRSLAQLPGRVEIVFGDPSPSTTGDRSVTGSVADDEFGFSVAGVGQIDGGGGDDVVIGAPRNDGAGLDAGQAYLYPGGSSTLASPATLPVYEDVPTGATAAGDLYGQCVAGGGDFDGDSLADFLVGAPAGNNVAGGPTAGFVHLIHSTSGVVPNELQSWRADWLAEGGVVRVGLSFAFATPPSRIADITVTRLTLDAYGQVRRADAVWRGAPGAPGLAVADGGFRYEDAGPFEVPVGGSLNYDLTAVTDTGAVLELKSLAGPQGAAPVFGLAVREPRPNPSSVATAVFGFRARPGDPVQVRVYDLRGRMVRTLFDGAGSGVWQEIGWDGRDDAGAPVGSGVYHLVVRSPEGMRATRAVLMR